MTFPSVNSNASPNGRRTPIFCLTGTTWRLKPGRLTSAPVFLIRSTTSLGVLYSPLWVTRPPSTSSENDALLNVRALLTYQLR